MANEIAVIKPRLPMPQGASVDAGTWRVLCESVFPSAKTSEAVCMALDYCKARKLDILKKPVHIVPMWSASLGRQVETVWPSIGEVQTTAARTGQWAGMDEPKWGPEITRTFKGRRDPKSVGEVEITITYPEWCAVTVYRLINGQKCAFTEPVYWLEAYARIGKSELPNDMWAKRTRGQIIKVAKAFSLRAAFPEEGFYVAEEMEGHIVEDVGVDGVVIDGNEPLKTKSIFKNNGVRKAFMEAVTKAISESTTLEQLKEVAAINKPKIEEMEKNANEHDLQAVDELRKSMHMQQFKLQEKPTDEESTFDEEVELDKQMDQAIDIDGPRPPKVAQA